MLNLNQIIVFWLLLTLVDLGTTASLFSIRENPNLNNHFIRIINQGIHLPILLHMNSESKRDICDQIVESDRFKKRGLRKVNLQDPNDQKILEKFALKNRLYEGIEEVIFPVSVQTLNKFFDTHFSTPLIQDIAMDCLAVIEEPSGNLIMDTLRISYAFAWQTYFVSVPLLELENNQVIAVGDLSPTYVEFDQTELEKYYLKIREKIENLRREKSEVARRMEKKSLLSSLILSVSNFKKLCMSICDTKFYKDKSIEYDDSTQLIMSLKLRILKFKSVDNFDLMYTENVICPAKEAGNKIQLYATHSYNEEYAVFVQKKTGYDLHLDSYIKNIPILKNLESQIIQRGFDFELL